MKLNINQQNNKFVNYPMNQMNWPNQNMMQANMNQGMNMLNPNMNFGMPNNINNNFNVINGANAFNNNMQNNFINNNMNNQFNNNMNNQFNNNMNNQFNNNMNNQFNNNVNNQFNNMNNNNFMHNSPSNLKIQLLNESLKEKDPLKIQMKVALGLNNNRAYQNNLAGGNQPSFLRQSSRENSSFGNEGRINIIFKGMQGNKHVRNFNRTDTIRQMLIKVLKSFGLHEYHLTKIYFLFNATNLLHVNQNQTIEKFGLKDNSNITMMHNK